MINNIIDFDNLNLKHDSNYLKEFYKILIENYKILDFSHTNSKDIQYYEIQLHIYKNLVSIYSKIKDEYKNGYMKYREKFDTSNIIYKNLIIEIYNDHLNHNRYVPEELKQFIKNNPDNKNINLLIYNLPYYSVNIKVHFFIYSKDIDYDIYDNYVRNILATIHLIDYMTSDILCNKDGINIYIFLTPFKRKIERTNYENLGEKNANGGFCYGCQNKGNVIIFREEEFMKVLTHELLHTFGIDKYIWKFKGITNKQTSKEYKLYKKFIGNFNLSREINENKNYDDIGIQECYVEFFAIFINIVIFSYNYIENVYKFKKVQEKIKVKYYIKTIDNLYNIETLHSFLQMSKILVKNNILFNSLLSKNVKNFNNYRETSHIFSYYILKLSLIFDYKKFLINYIHIHKNKYIIKLNNLKQILFMFNYIIEIFNNKKFIKTGLFFEEFYEFLSKNIDKSKKDDLILNNFRMTVIEY